MEFESGLFKSTSSSRSLKTTVPQPVVATLELEESDSLVWVPDPKSGTVLVRRRARSPATEGSALPVRPR